MFIKHALTSITHVNSMAHDCDATLPPISQLK